MPLPVAQSSRFARGPFILLARLCPKTNKIIFVCAMQLRNLRVASRAARSKMFTQHHHTSAAYAARNSNGPVCCMLCAVYIYMRGCGSSVLVFANAADALFKPRGIVSVWVSFVIGFVNACRDLVWYICKKGTKSFVDAHQVWSTSTGPSYVWSVWLGDHHTYTKICEHKTTNKAINKKILCLSKIIAFFGYYWELGKIQRHVI